jgi:cell division GTPase FtsZ
MKMFENLMDIDDVETKMNKLKNCNGAIKIGIIAAGQGGCKIAKVFHDLGYPCLFTNTSKKDLDQSIFNDVKPEQLMKIGGFDIDGSGKNPEHSKQLYESSYSEILNKITSLFESDIEKFLVIGTIGGGCGTGAIEPLVKILYQYFYSLGVPRDKIYEKIGVITTLPKINEANGNKQNILERISKLSEAADKSYFSPFMILDNELLMSMFKKVSLIDFYPAINKTFINSLHVFNYMANQTSDLGITLDKADLMSILNSGGHLINNILQINDNSIINNVGHIEEQFDAMMSKYPLVKNYKMQSTKYIGLVIIANESIYKLSGINEIIENIKTKLSRISENTVLHVGVYNHDKNSNRPFCLYTMFGGLTAPTSLYTRLQ